MDGGPTSSSNGSQGADEVATVADARRAEVQYARSSDNARIYKAELRRLTAPGSVRVLDVGGGAKPTLRLTRIENEQIDYVVTDIDAEELAAAPAEYRKVAGDVLERETIMRLLDTGGQFDVVISRWVAEHMRDGRAFHENVFSLLAPGGTAVHLFPTLYAVPFMVNRILADRISRRLLFNFTKRDVKFPAHYSWCYGPTERQLSGLRDVGFEIERYVGFFGHGFFAPVAPVHAAYRRLVHTLMRHPVPSLTAFAVAVLKRPAA
ncbi:MAG TPA: methyltransferase [Solirubrobacteraceae bacterium]|nr:methyltransferase [Solirubrobacteraceae bacterium]